MHEPACRRPPPTLPLARHPPSLPAAATGATANGARCASSAHKTAPTAPTAGACARCAPSATVSPGGAACRCSRRRAVRAGCSSPSPLPASLRPARPPRLPLRPAPTPAADACAPTPPAPQCPTACVTCNTAGCKACHRGFYLSAKRTCERVRRVAGRRGVHPDEARWLWRGGHAPGMRGWVSNHW